MDPGPSRFEGSGWIFRGGGTVQISNSRVVNMYMRFIYGATDPRNYTELHVTQTFRQFRHALYYIIIMCTPYAVYPYMIYDLVDINAKYIKPFPLGSH
jgi:hypothetical protein